MHFSSAMHIKCNQLWEKEAQVCLNGVQNLVFVERQSDSSVSQFMNFHKKFHRTRQFFLD